MVVEGEGGSDDGIYGRDEATTWSGRGGMGSRSGFRICEWDGMRK